AVGGQRLSLRQATRRDLAPPAGGGGTPRPAGVARGGRRTPAREPGHPRPSPAAAAPPPRAPAAADRAGPERRGAAGAAADVERVDPRPRRRAARRSGLALWGVDRRLLSRHARRHRRRDRVDGTAGDLGPPPPARDQRRPSHPPAAALPPARVA